ncbi:MAG TPA: GDSL-type esterase/lipase family protein [Vicinamibacterales bacterium]|nr:GDSL-type esterase/lipase family protein [Vicinamibacterales bacterium]
MFHNRILAILSLIVAIASPVWAQPGQKWVATWAASVHGPYPAGNASAQPDLSFAFPDGAQGAVDQSFRLIVKPDLWGDRVRIRLANTFGTQSITFDGIYVGVAATGGHIVKGTNRAVLFNGQPTIAIAPGASSYSDAVDLKLPSGALTEGRKLAVSFHVTGPTGPMTWHAKALQTSYVSRPRSGSHTKAEDEAAFPYTTTSWYFLDAVDVMAPASTVVVCTFGDSITDGTLSTLNGDDRWPDVLSRRLHAAYGHRVSVVNAGIGGNRILTPDSYPPPQPFSGGPSALQRLDRDVLGLSGVAAVVLLEGINDISAGASADAIIAGMRELVSRVKARGLKTVGATITPSLTATGASGTPDANARRQTINAFIRTGGLFDAIADFDAATVDPNTGALRAEFVPNSTIGGAGDRLHPNRAGYQAMGSAIDVKIFAPR